MLVLERQQASNKWFSRIWMAGILVTILLTLFLNKKSKRQII